MHRILPIVLILGFSILYGQNPKKDSLYVFTKNTENGGEFSMEIDESLAKLMMSKEQAVCNKPVYVPPKKLTPADKCATQQKIMGYKIQIFYTKDREAANKVKNDFSRQFPSLTAELIYASPDYRILVGDYFTRSTASPDLRRIQRSYPSAFSVQWRVWCRKAL
ncbi:SPOR domain-containing protein [Moheibacter sediminis]|uniref:Sporulation related domain-containing protein n=1 Tax=Moheibacter sediminis TaxID=1434700 RepID=A0A1W2CIS7_9FLAO|nr:SPOR domain-containing protein [Moheibacter sediminis]SMC84782.1 Sporulation related domain-containing protein [Moheibacter sediminis]